MTLDRRGIAMRIEMPSLDDIAKVSGLSSHEVKYRFMRHMAEMKIDTMEDIAREEQPTSTKSKSSSADSPNHRKSAKLNFTTNGETHLHPQRKSKYPPVE